MNLTINTSRCILRNFLPSDARFLYDLNSDPLVIQFTGDPPFKSENEALLFIQNYSQYQKYETGRLTVLDRQSGEYLGWCGLRFDEATNMYDLGFRFFRKYWNKGFATETSKAVLNYYFKEKKLKEIYGKAMALNGASVKVLEKVGMKLVKEVDFEGEKALLYVINNNDVFF